MMKPIKCIVETCAIASLVFVLAVSLASAGLRVSGVTFDAEVAPGLPFEHEIEVGINDTDNPMDILVDVYGYAQSPNGVTEAIENDLDTSPYAAREFVAVSPKNFHLEPGESQKVIVSGTMPSDAGDGGRYAVVNIHTLPMGEGNIGFALAANVPVRLTINGSKLIETGEIKSIEIGELDLTESHDIFVVFENTGNHHYLAKAEAVLKNNDGDQLAIVAIPLMTNPIIPAYSTIFQLTMGENLTRETCTTEVSVIHENGTVLDRMEKTLAV